MKAKFSLIGNLCRDPEIKHTGSGTTVANMSVACNRSVKKGDQWEKEVSFFNVVMFGKQADLCNKYLVKGARVGFDGYMRQESWETQDGQKRNTIKFYATELYFLSSKRESSGESYGGDNFGDDEDDQVPF
jgi:single-strand DNA-binding protein